MTEKSERCSGGGMTKLRECRKELQYASFLNSIFNSNWASSTVEKDEEVIVEFKVGMRPWLSEKTKHTVFYV